MTHYAASKGGVIALTKARAVEFARSGITANSVAMCSFLCSDGGAYITGQLIGVNGGMYI